MMQAGGATYLALRRSFVPLAAGPLKLGMYSHSFRPSSSTLSSSLNISFVPPHMAFQLHLVHLSQKKFFSLCIVFYLYAVLSALYKKRIIPLASYQLGGPPAIIVSPAARTFSPSPNSLGKILDYYYTRS